MNTTILPLICAVTLTLTNLVYGAVTLVSVGNERYRADFDPITFEITNGGGLSIVLFKDFFSSPNMANGRFTSGDAESGTFTILVNAGSPQTISHDGPSGTRANTFGLIDDNDLFFNSDFFVVSQGDTLTISGSNLIFQSQSPGSFPSSGPFEVTLADGAGNALSNTVTVPEPSSAILLACSTFFLFRRLR